MIFGVTEEEIGATEEAIETEEEIGATEEAIETEENTGATEEEETEGAIEAAAE